MKGLLIVGLVALVAAGCEGSSTHAASSPPRSPGATTAAARPKAPAHRGVITISRSSGTSTGNTVKVAEVDQPRWCVSKLGRPICAAVIDYRDRFRMADLRCKLGPGTTGVRGTIDGQLVHVTVPPVDCLTGHRLKHDAEVLDLPPPSV